MRPEMHANPRVNWALRIAPRGNSLAARQAEEVRARLVATHALSLPESDGPLPKCWEQQQAKWCSVNECGASSII